VEGRFQGEVVAQVARLGGDAERAADQVARLLTLPPGEVPPPAMTGDPVLLSVLFQNIDLLYADDHPAADRIARLVMAAIHEMEAGGG